MARDVIVALVHHDAPDGAALREEFGVRFGNSWVVVLDGKGEALAGWMGDWAGGDCDDNSTGAFARNFVVKVRTSLEQTDSVQELERRWQSAPADMAALDALTTRLSEMDAQDKIRQLCEAAAANGRLPRHVRDELRIRAFRARANVWEHTTDPEAQARFMRDGETLLAEVAAHLRAAELVGALFHSGYTRGFDVPARSARGIARLRRVARKAADPALLLERVRELAQMRRSWIEHMTEAVRTQEHAYSRDWLAAQLGDPRAAIRLFGRPEYKGVPEYEEWLQEARRKKERQRRQRTTRAVGAKS